MSIKVDYPTSEDIHCSIDDVDYTELFYYPDQKHLIRKEQFVLGQRIMARVQDSNSSGIVFGGWIFSQMDTGVAVVAQKKTGGPVATIGVDDFLFLDCVLPGELVTVYCALKDVGNTSIRFKAEAWAIDHKEGQAERKVASGLFTFVALDGQGQPRMISSQL
ncbi:MAG: acyl-CoA thioesterase [Methyloligellaceae bacterium]